VEIGRRTELESGVTYVFDKGYYHFGWWKKINDTGAFPPPVNPSKPKPKSLPISWSSSMRDLSRDSPARSEGRACRSKPCYANSAPGCRRKQSSATIQG
jgi:hypothetical protein